MHSNIGRNDTSTLYEAWKDTSSMERVEFA